MDLQHFFWNVAGAETKILEKCPTDYKRFSSIGATICMTSFIAFLAGTSAAWYFTQSGEGQVSGAIWWSLLFGAVWALLIFCIDRSLVITLKKKPDNTNKLYWVTPLLSRAALAAIIAFMVSIPLELFIFKDFIEANSEAFVSEKARQFGEEIRSDTGEDDLNRDLDLGVKNVNSLQKTLDTDSADLRKVNSDLVSLRNSIDNPNTEAYRKAKARYNDADAKLRAVDARIRKLKDDDQTVPSKLLQERSSYSSTKANAQNEMTSLRSEWNKKVRKQIEEKEQTQASLRGKVAETSASIKEANDMNLANMRQGNEMRAKRNAKQEITETQYKNGNQFIRNFQILEYAVWHRNKKGELVNTSNLLFLGLVRLLFFIIEILPTVVKIVTPVGSYDRMVYAREKSMEEYLNSEEFKESMRILHEADTKVQVEEAKLRQETELKMRKEILDDIAQAQTDIAKLAVESWEAKERAKLRIDPTEADNRPKSKPKPPTLPDLNVEKFD